MKTVDKYLKKELKYYYKNDKEIIDDFILSTLDSVDDLVKNGMSVELAHKVTIDRLHNLDEFKQTLTPVNLTEKARTNFLYSVYAVIIIFVILMLLSNLLKIRYIYAMIISVATLFWPLSMWLNYRNKREL